MPNQFFLGRDKENEILFWWILKCKTQHQIAKMFRLNPKTIKYIIKKHGLANYKNLINTWYIKRRKNESN